LNRDGTRPVIGNNCVGSELGHLYLDIFRAHPNIVTLRNGTMPCIYWMSTEASAEEAYAIDLFTLRQGTLWKDPFLAEVSEHFHYAVLCSPGQCTTAMWQQIYTPVGSGVLSRRASLYFDLKTCAHAGVVSWLISRARTS
jgi:hypothetical protein